MTEEHNIDKIIDTGKFDLHVDKDEGVTFKVGEPLVYEVIEGGVIQEDGTVPIRIRIEAPKQYKGRVVKATLVPFEDPRAPMMRGIGLGPVIGES